MNSKAIKRQLLAAIAMVLVAAIALGSSTYAWFAANTSVTATGANVTAETPTTILISKTSATEEFGSTIAMENESKMGATVYPVHWTGDKNVTGMLKLTADGLASVNQAGKRTGTHANAKFEANDTFVATTSDYFLETFWLSYQGPTASTETSLTVKVEWAGTAPTSTLKGAVHAVFVKANGEIIVDYDMSNAGTEKDFVTLANSTTGTEYKVYLIVDGEDAECYNAAASVKEAFNVKITFAEKPATSVGP